MRKVRFGTIHADDVSFAGALDAIANLVAAGRGGFVVTPNVDHVCLAEEHTGLREAYAKASLSLVDGMPLLWLSRLMGVGLPEKISGSDLAEPLMARAAAEGWRVFFLGGAPGVAEAAADALRARHKGLQVVESFSPPMGFEKDAAADADVCRRIGAARAQLVLVALGCPKQEVWMSEHAAALGGAVTVGVGATLDFIAGRVRRAPAWLSRIGLEWLYRLAQEPGRMAQRYLVRDRAFARIAWQMLRAPASARVITDR